MDAILAAIGGALGTGLISYLVVRRKNSGSISTSDAADLWAESNALRKDYRDRANQLEEQLEDVNNKLQTVMGELTKLKANSSTMIRKINELKRIISNLRAENKRLLALKGSAHGPQRA